MVLTTDEELVELRPVVPHRSPGSDWVANPLIPFDLSSTAMAPCLDCRKYFAAAGIPHRDYRRRFQGTILRLVSDMSCMPEMLTTVSVLTEARVAPNLNKEPSSLMLSIGRK